jgi:diguanylate cyclase (GGDEF)-like protein
MANVGKEYIDDLTGLYNRRYLHKMATIRIDEAWEREIHLSIVLIDLDHFKKVNDTYGHARGDVVLKEFGQFLQSMLRQNDMVFRYGGDEFISILPHANYDQTMRISQRFIEECRKREFAKIRLTLSIGIASLPENAKDWPTLFEFADRNLYNAKRHGRDQVGMFEKEKRQLVIPTKDFVGRKDEMVKVKELLKPVYKGIGRAVNVSGEMGIGKTRFVHELVNEVVHDDFLIAETNLSATTQSIPYFPFREVIRVIIGKEGKGSIEQIPQAYQIELGKIVPELWGKVQEGDKHVLMIDKFRLFEGVRRFLARLSSEKVIFLFLDNVHWADDSSLGLFHYLVRTLKENSVFFAFTYRVEEVKRSSLPTILPLVMRESLYDEITLGPLQKEEVTQMLSLILGTIPPKRLVEYIYKETGGNSFFIEELVRALEVHNALTWEDGNWIMDESKKVVIPYSVQGMVVRKLKMLSSEAYRLMEYSVVIGREFDFLLLQYITEMNEGHLIDVMDEILEMRLLKEREGRYCFTEDIIREVIYSKIKKTKLTHYHQIIGDKLLDFYKDCQEEIVEELAVHFYKGGDRKRAIEYCMIAADRARNVYANQDAFKFYTWVLESLDESVDNREMKEIECFKKRARILNLLGEKKSSISDLRKAIETAKKINNVKEEADCLITLCIAHEGITQYQFAIEEAKKALRIYRKISDIKGEARALQQIGIVHTRLGKYQEALQFFLDSLTVGEKERDTGTEAGNLNAIGLLYYNLGEYKKALKLFRESQQLHERIGDRKGKALDFNNIGGVFFSLGEYQKALEFCEKSLEMHEDIGDRTGKAANLNNMGSLCNHMSELQKALVFYRDSLKIHKEIGERRGEALCRNNIGGVYYSLGEYEKAMEFYKISLEITQEIGDRYGEADSLRGFGNSFLEMNNIPAAEEYYKKARIIARELKSKPLLANDAFNMATLHIEKNRIAQAKREMKRLSSFVDEMGSVEKEGLYLFLSGRLFMKEKNWNDAKTYFKKSLLVLKQCEKKHILAKVYYYQGLMFKEIGEEKSAKESFKKAKAIFKKVGAIGWLKKV